MNTVKINLMKFFGHCRERLIHSVINRAVSVLILTALTLSFSGCFGCSDVLGDTQPPCALLYRIDSGKLLYGTGCNERIAPASITKLLTASVALRYIASDRVFTVGSEIDLAKPNSSLCLISQGQSLTLFDLITGMLMVSGNDAAYTVAVSVAKEVSGNESMSDGEAVKYFCRLMNDFAQTLGMNDSHFTTPDGWDSENQYTTLSDLLKLAKYALSVPEIREITSTYQKYVLFDSGENITWTNSNRLLDPNGEFYCQYAKGMKTGTTAKAGSCLIAVFEKDGAEYISIAAKCPNDKSRYELTLDIFYEYGE